MTPALKAELDIAVEAYMRECERLIGFYLNNELPDEWHADEHGEHCRFENIRTGHIVESPLPELTENFPVDPYFFGVFVKTGSDFSCLKQKIKHEFHDSIALLDARAPRKHDA